MCLLITDLCKETLQETADIARRLNERVNLIVEAADITQRDTAEKLVNIAVKRFGRLDYGINVAGTSFQRTARPIPVWVSMFSRH